MARGGGYWFPLVLPELEEGNHRGCNREALFGVRRSKTAVRVY